jgi:hypothetical protein
MVLQEHWHFLFQLRGTPLPLFCLLWLVACANGKYYQHPCQSKAKICIEMQQLKVSTLLVVGLTLRNLHVAAFMWWLLIELPLDEAFRQCS